MRRKGLGRCVRSVIEELESRVLFDSIAVGTGTSAITGVVKTDAGVPIPGATVYIDFNKDHTLDGPQPGGFPGDPNVLTDNNGGFSFTQIKGGLYWLEVIANLATTQVTVTGAPTGGTFTLTVTNNLAAATTAPIAFNASAGTVQTAINNLNNLGPGTAVVTGANGGPWIIQWQGIPVPTVAATSSLTGGTSPNVTVMNIPIASQQDAPGYVEVNLPVTAMPTQNPQVIAIHVSTALGISGLLFNDINENSVYEPSQGETPLVGDTVFVDSNGNGILDPGELSAITNAFGVYNIDEPPGIYQVRVIPRPGFHQDPPGVVVTTVGNGNQVIANIGESKFSIVSGTVFLDSNGNGVQDAGEPGVSGETVELLQNGVSVATATTGPNGGYFMNTLSPGQYQLVVMSNAAPVANVQDLPGYIDVTLVQDQDLGENVGEGQPATVTGLVFDDKNGNGVQDKGDLGLPGQTVYLDLTNNGALDGAGALDQNGQPLSNAEPSAVTDANGNYTITNLGPGTYTERIQLPNGATPISPANASFSYTFTLGSGQTLTAQNFSFKTPDLTISVIHLPIAPVFGNVTENAVFRITNVGALPAIGTTEIQLYVSTVAVFNVATATSIDVTAPVAISLKPGQSKVFKVPFVYPPTQLTGLYYTTAQVLSTVGDSNASNDFAASVGPISVTQPLLDLSLAYASQPDATVAPGTSTTLNVLVTNNGNVTTTGELVFRVYITTTNIIEPDDVVAQSFTISKVKLKAGASKVYHLVLHSPGPSVGQRFPIVYVDSGDQLGEANLANNVATPLAATLFL